MHWEKANGISIFIPWFELIEMPRVGLAWYDDDEEVDERVPGADDGDRRL